MSELKKVIVAKAKLNGNETDNELHAMLISHTALESNGFIRNYISCNTKGEPEYIVSLWSISKFDTGVLPKGQRYAYIIA